MNRTSVINQLALQINAKTYLEIGVDNGINFRNVKCPNKTSVDPAEGRYKSAKPTHKMTSDLYFESFKDDRYDLIFIDGLHHSEQVLKDINNSLKILNEGGYIICHDMNPMTEEEQIVPRESKTWLGDCWKAWITLRATRPDLHMQVVDIDHGCGVISYGKQEILDIDITNLSYEDLRVNRESWLNLISVETFKAQKK